MIGCYKATSRRSGPSPLRLTGGMGLTCPRSLGQETKTEAVPEAEQPSVFERDRLRSRRESQRQRREAESSTSTSLVLGLREGERKQYVPYDGPRRVSVILDRATFNAAGRFLGDHEDIYGGLGHVIGQLAKAKLSDLSYLYEKSPLENIETAYKRTLREQAENERRLEIRAIRSSWSGLKPEVKRHWLERYPAELKDLPSPEIPNQ